MLVLYSLEASWGNTFMSFFLLTGFYSASSYSILDLSSEIGIEVFVRDLEILLRTTLLFSTSFGLRVELWPKTVLASLEFRLLRSLPMNSEFT